MTDDEEWLETLSRIADGVPCSDDPKIPMFPDPTLQRNTTGAAGSAGLPEVFQFYLDCREAFAKVRGRPLAYGDSMLDFGCGWGRVGRMFLRDIRLADLYGMDVNPDLVAECRTSFASSNFKTNKPFPPTNAAASSFDLITGFSVFSHLSESACNAWMAEFSRLLKPNGLIAMTTRGRDFFSYCRSLRGNAVPGTYQHFLSLMFDDFDAAIARYDRGEFVHSNAQGVTGGGILSGEFYGESFIPRAYAESGFGSSVRFVGWLPGAQGQRLHPVMFFSGFPK